MAEYTRDIQQLTRDAKQQPTFAPPSPSLAGDLVNLANTGLQFYAKGEAEDALQEQMQAQASQERRLAQGVLGFRRVRQELSGQDLTRTQIIGAEEKFLSSFSPEERLQIIGGTNTLTGQKTKDVMSEADAERKRRKEELEGKVLRGGGYAQSVLGLSQEEVTGASEEQLTAWSKKADMLDANIEMQKQILQVSESKTAPVIEVARSVFFEKTQTKLSKIRKAQQEGNAEQARVLGDEFRREIIDLQRQAPETIKEMLGPDNQAFYDAGLVTSYTNEIASLLDNATVKDVLSGKETNQSTLNEVENLISAKLSKQFFESVKKVEQNKSGANEINDINSIVTWFSSRQTGTSSLTKKGLERAILQSLGAENSSQQTDVSETRDSQEKNEDSFHPITIVGGALSETIGLFNKSTTEEIKEVNGLTQEYITSKLDKGEKLSQADVGWIENSLSFGLSGNTEKRGKGASKAMLDAPLTILAREDYATTVKPAVDEAIANGVDPISALTMSLDNHIKNNYSNAFTELVELGSQGLGEFSLERNRPAMSSQKTTANLKEDAVLVNNNGNLEFKYKSGVTGTYTDSKMIYNLRSLNNATSVLNKYVSALSNVTGSDKKDVADEVRGLLNRNLGIQLDVEVSERQSTLNTENPKDWNGLAKQQGVDLTSFEDGTYQDGSGKIVTIKNGQVVSVE